jgi:hypothetical protein
MENTAAAMGDIKKIHKDEETSQEDASQAR